MQKKISSCFSSSGIHKLLPIHFDESIDENFEENNANYEKN